MDNPPSSAQSREAPLPHLQPSHRPHPTGCFRTHRKLLPPPIDIECPALDFTFSGQNTHPPPNLAIHTLHPRIHSIYTILITPTALPIIHFCHGSVLNAAHSIFCFGGQNPRPRLISPFPAPTTTCIVSTPPYMRLLHSPGTIYITDQYRVQCIRYSVWGSKSPPKPDLAISILHHRICLIYTTSYTLTAPTAIEFDCMPVPNAAYLVFGFGGQNPRPHLISPFPAPTTTCIVSTLPYMRLLHSPGMIYITDQY